MKGRSEAAIKSDIRSLGTARGGPSLRERGSSRPAIEVNAPLLAVRDRKCSQPAARGSFAGSEPSGVVATSRELDGSSMTKASKRPPGSGARNAKTELAEPAKRAKITAKDTGRLRNTILHLYPPWRSQ